MRGGGEKTRGDWRENKTSGEGEEHSGEEDECRTQKVLSLECSVISIVIMFFWTLSISVSCLSMQNKQKYTG